VGREKIPARRVLNQEETLLFKISCHEKFKRR